MRFRTHYAAELCAAPRVRRGAAGHSWLVTTSADNLLRRAIAERRVVSFTLSGCRRVAEPHDYGVINGETRLFFYQTGGQSRSGKPMGWRWAVLSKISDLALLDERFPGARAAPSERHVKWDVLFASVSSDLRSR